MLFAWNMVEYNLQLAIANLSASYYVEVPETIAIGELSRENDTRKEYQVAVTASDLGTGRITVSAPQSGTLANGEHTIAFTNNFQTQTFTQAAVSKGVLMITKEAVQNATVGTYTGTTTFEINYYAQ